MVNNSLCGWWLNRRKGKYMRKLTFTFFRKDNDKVYGYRFDITRVEAQKIAEKIAKEENVLVYYMDGYIE